MFQADDKLLLLQRAAAHTFAHAETILACGDQRALVRGLPDCAELRDSQIDEALQALAERSGVLIPEGTDPRGLLADRVSTPPITTGDRDEERAAPNTGSAARLWDRVPRGPPRGAAAS